MPAIVSSQVLRASSGYDEFLPFTPPDVFDAEYQPVVAPLPGRSDDEVAAYRNSGDVWYVDKKVDAEAGPFIVRIRLRGEDLLDAELRLDCPVTYVEWDGGRTIAHPLTGEQVAVMDAVFARVETRLNRPTTKAEREQIRRYVGPQLHTMRGEFLRKGWTPAPRTNHDVIPRVIARRLLNPQLTNEAIAREFQLAGAERYADADALSTACRELAAKLSLGWPPSRR